MTPTNGFAMWQLVDSTWDLANTMMKSAGLHLHVTVLIVSREKEILAVKSDWAGGEPKQRRSRGAYFGPAKAAQLRVSISQTDPEVVLTPVSGWEALNPYAGGVRRRVGENYYITAASGWSQEGDALVAAVLNVAMTQEVRLHHVGISYPHVTDWTHAILLGEATHRREALCVPVLSHNYQRYFIRVPETGKGPEYWMEYCFYEQEPRTTGVHWDFVAPEGLLLITVSDMLGVKLAIRKPIPGELPAPHSTITHSEESIGRVSFEERLEWWDVAQAKKVIQ